MATSTFICDDLVARKYETAPCNLPQPHNITFLHEFVLASISTHAHTHTHNTGHTCTQRNEGSSIVRVVCKGSTSTSLKLLTRLEPSLYVCLYHQSQTPHQSPTLTSREPLTVRLTSTTSRKPITSLKPLNVRSTSTTILKPITSLKPLTARSTSTTSLKPLTARSTSTTSLKPLTSLKPFTARSTSTTSLKPLTVRLTSTTSLKPLTSLESLTVRLPLPPHQSWTPHCTSDLTALHTSGSHRTDELITAT